MSDKFASRAVSDICKAMMKRSQNDETEDLYICKLVSYGNAVYEYEPVGEIIKCKDCRWYLYDGICLDSNRSTSLNDFCSWGERKEEVEHDD